MKIDIRRTLVVFLSFVLALYLHLIALSDPLNYINPQWFVLTFIYWNLLVSHRIGLAFTVVLGLLLDIFEGGILGLHSIALLLVQFVCIFGYQRFRVFTHLQKSLIIFALVATYLYICYWLNGLVSQTAGDPKLMLSALSSALVWPIVFSFLRVCRRKYSFS